ncbi:MAG: hypothetical protein L0323_23350, partial [Planctomycetes bacterium]|nr:hypothetical protein [Planctomycetota bacterium]
MCIASRRRLLGILPTLLILAGAVPAQVTTLFSENFEGPPGPVNTVGAYTETDPFAGVPAPTLWHAEGACSVCVTGGYVVTTSAAPFTTLLGNPAAVAIFVGGDDGFSGRILLPFTFTHYGAPFSFGAIDINRNGFLATFPGGGGGTDFINEAPGNPNPPNGVIGPWWDDLTHTTGVTLLSIQGAAPNRRAVIEWHGLEAFPGNSSGENATFQAVINETTNVLEFHYDNASFAAGGDPWSATVGSENFDGTIASDLTCLQDLNSTFPATGFLLTPGVPPPPTPTPISACMGNAAAAYNQGDTFFFAYNTGSANAGAIESPAVVSTSATSTLVMIFDFTKETEAGGTSTFDQCFVETSPTGAGTWSPVMQITGNTGPCVGPIQTQVAILPAGLSGTSFQHRFRFDTIDSVGNDYFGWYVDNIRIDQAPGSSVLSYSENFESGTTAGVTVGNMTEEDEFGSPLDVQWHAETDCDAVPTPIPAPLAGSAAAYNQGDVGNFTYDTPFSANSGALVSPSFTVPAGTVGLTVAFDYLKETEGGGATVFDQCFVEGRSSPFASWDPMVQVAGNQPCFSPGSFTANSGGSGFSTLIAGGGGQLRLRFNTVDSVGNAYLGWYVDNLTLTSQTVALTPTAGAGCPSSGGCTPTISGSGLPAVGNSSFALVLGNAQPATVAALILSAGVTNVPISLFIPGSACTLLVPLVAVVSPIPVSPGAGCSGTATLPLAIPCGIPAGIGINAQFAVIEPAIFPASPLSVSMT